MIEQKKNIITLLAKIKKIHYCVMRPIQDKIVPQQYFNHTYLNRAPYS